MSPYSLKLKRLRPAHLDEPQCDGLNEVDPETGELRVLPDPDPEDEEDRRRKQSPGKQLAPMPGIPGPFQSSGFSGEFVSNIKLLSESDKHNLKRIVDLLCVRYGRPGHRRYDTKNRSLYLRACEIVGKARHVYAGNPRSIRADVEARIGEVKARALENDVMLGLEFHKRINEYHDLHTDCREEHLLLTAVLFHHQIKHNKQGWCWGEGYRYARQYFAPCESEMLAELADRLYRHADKIYSTTRTGTKLLNKKMLFLIAKNWTNTRSVRVPKAFRSRESEKSPTPPSGMQWKSTAFKKHDEKESDISSSRKAAQAPESAALPPDDDDWEGWDDPFGGHAVMVNAPRDALQAHEDEALRRSLEEMDRFLADDSW